MTIKAAPKAKALYEEFYNNLERDPGEVVRTWDELSEREQQEWQVQAGELDELMGQGEPMHHPPIAKQGETPDEQ